MLTFNASNVPTLSPFSQKRFDIMGDGKSTKLEINLTKAPLGMRFEGDKFPCAVYVLNGPVGSNAYTDQGRLAFILREPLLEGETASITVSFFYADEANDLLSLQTT